MYVRTVRVPDTLYSCCPSLKRVCTAADVSLWLVVDCVDDGGLFEIIDDPRSTP